MVSLDTGRLWKFFVIDLLASPFKKKKKIISEIFLFLKLHPHRLSISVSSLSLFLCSSWLFFTVYLYFFVDKNNLKCDTKESLMNNGECVGQDEAERAWRWECRKCVFGGDFVFGQCFVLYHMIFRTFCFLSKKKKQQYIIIHVRIMLYY